MTTSATRAEIEAFLQSNRQRHLERILEFLAIPSFAGSKGGGRRASEFLVSSLQEIGCQRAELVEVGGPPGVFGQCDVGADSTIVTYGMYDTKPPHPDGSSVDPLGGALVDVESYGRCIVGPGAFARKGPLIVWLNALEAVMAVTGSLPFNLVFLAEGQENLGSPGYAALMDRYRKDIDGAALCIGPGAACRDGRFHLRLGYKGLLIIRLTSGTSNRAAGDTSTPVLAHGMSQGLVESPAWRLVEALSFLVADSGRSLTVPGFYSSSTPPTARELEDVRRVIARNHGTPLSDVLDGLGTTIDDRVGPGSESALIRYYFEPSFNLHRISLSGQAESSLTIPSEASATLDIRLPRGYVTTDVTASIRDHLDANGLDDVELDVLAEHPAWAVNPDDPAIKAVRAACRIAGIDLETQPYTGGGGPWTRFGAEHGMPVVFNVGLSTGGRPGGPDEFLVVDESGPVPGLVQSELWYVDFLSLLARSDFETSPGPP